jgi:hypothetical protein
VRRCQPSRPIIRPPVEQLSAHERRRAPRSRGGAASTIKVRKTCRGYGSGPRRGGGGGRRLCGARQRAAGSLFEGDEGRLTLAHSWSAAPTALTCRRMLRGSANAPGDQQVLAAGAPHPELEQHLHRRHRRVPGGSGRGRHSGPAQVGAQTFDVEFGEDAPPRRRDIEAVGPSQCWAPGTRAS